MGLLKELVSRPSENRAPIGFELACQEFITGGASRNAGWDPVLYTLAEVPGLHEHPHVSAWSRLHGTAERRRKAPGRGRRQVAGAVRSCRYGSYRSPQWSRDPFGGEIEGNRLYGRGSTGGIATNLFVVEALREFDIRLAGDLVFESVVDEEFGGVNGTLAGRLMNFNADGAIISEPTSLRVCPAQRGSGRSRLPSSLQTGVSSRLRDPAPLSNSEYFSTRSPTPRTRGSNVSRRPRCTAIS